MGRDIPSQSMVFGGGPIDAFDAAPALPTRPTIQPPAPQSAVPTPSASGIGGIFSSLWDSVKGALGGLVSKASDWFSTNVGPLIDKAKSWVSNFVGGWLGKAASWLGGLLGTVQNKLPH